jgi:hypothetical protein
MATFANLTSACERCRQEKTFDIKQAVRFEVLGEGNRVLPPDWSVLELAYASKKELGTPRRDIQELCDACTADCEKFMRGEAVSAVVSQATHALGAGETIPLLESKKDE